MNLVSKRVASSGAKQFAEKLDLEAQPLKRGV